MTRYQQIYKALELLNPPADRRALCQHEIELALDLILRGAEASRAFRLATSGKDRGGLRRYYAALRRLLAASNALDPAIKPWLSLAMRLETLGLDREIKSAELLLAQKPAPPSSDARRQQIAVAAANWLLEGWGHKAKITRGGE